MDILINKYYKNKVFTKYNKSFVIIEPHRKTYQIKQETLYIE